MMFIKAISEFSKAIPAILIAASLAAAPGRAEAQELRLVPVGDAFDCMDFSIDVVLVNAGEPVFGFQVSLSFPAASFEPVSFEGGASDWSVRSSGSFPFAAASPCEPWADGEGVDRILIASTVYPDPGLAVRGVADEIEGAELVLGRIVFRSRSGAAGGVISASASDCPGSSVEFPTAFFNADGRTRSVNTEPLVVSIRDGGVEGLSCVVQGEAGVELSWEAPEFLESVRIVRDGETVGSVAAASGRYQDDPAPGIHRYEVIGVLSDGRESCAAICMAEVPFKVEDVPFIRGDADSSLRVNLTDGIQILRYLYQSGELDCLDAADVNDSGQIEIADAIYLLNFVFQSGEAIPAPHPAAGVDPTPDAIGCGPAA